MSIKVRMSLVRHTLMDRTQTNGSNPLMKASPAFSSGDGKIFAALAASSRTVSLFLSSILSIPNGNFFCLFKVAFSPLYTITEFRRAMTKERLLTLINQGCALDDGSQTSC